MLSVKQDREEGWAAIKNLRHALGSGRRIEHLGLALLSDRQVELLQERGKSRVVVQALQQGLHFCRNHTGITLGISSVQPLERFVGLVPESINCGDLERITCMVFHL